MRLTSLPSLAFAARRAGAVALLALPLAWLCDPAWALYKVVGPDGRVTYTDRAPADQPARALKANGASTPADALPYDLQKIVSRFPVTLFTGNNCTPCDTARQLLKSRGVPFTEKTVTTSEDIRQFRSQEATDQLPTVRIGQKQLSGLQHSDWNAYLDAAGYPATSTLPPSYRYAPASPLVPLANKTDAPADASGTATSASTPAPSGADTKTPAGIRF